MIEYAQKYYNDYISKRLIKFLISLGITANQLTIFNFVFTLIWGVYFFSRGTWIGNWLALGVCLINVVLDYADGDLARRQKKLLPIGEWLDCGGDIILQNSIMAAICFGICRGFAGGTSPLFAIIMLYFVGNSIMNVISFHYNETFGFHSYKGSALFRKYMETKPTLLNRFLKNLIDPTASAVGLAFYTIRYWIVFGAIFNQMKAILICVTIITTFRWVGMYILYALHLKHYKKLWVLQALAIIDGDREEYYKCRKLMP